VIVLMLAGSVTIFGQPAGAQRASAGAIAAASDSEVLILGSTVSGGDASVEAQAVAAMGLTPVVVDGATWSSLNGADFASYRGIVLGDATCGGDASPAIANASTWGGAIDGNVMLVGTDPVFHDGQGGAELTEKGVQFALSDSRKTGLYATLSCYFHDTAPRTPVPLLDGIEPGGFTVTGVGCYNDTHLVAEHPALSGITDATLSGWGCSVHEAFDTWPARFQVLAIARDFGAAFTASDGTVGTPYILASGSGLATFPLSASPTFATPSVGSTHTITGQLLDGTTREPVTGRLMRAATELRSGDVVIRSLLPCSTSLCLTGADGRVSYSYSSSVIRTDTVVVWIDDDADEAPGNGEPQVRVQAEWTQSTATPVLMIHGIDVLSSGGWNGNCPGFNDLKDYLRMHGFADRPLLTLGYYVDDVHCDRYINDSADPDVRNSYFDGVGAHGLGSTGHTPEAAIEHLGYHFAWWIYDNYSRYGIKVDVVAHSMGGLITRFALGKVQAHHSDFPPVLLVGDVVTMGTPHGGSRPGVLGRVCRMRECSQMAPGDGFLTSLEREAWNPQGEGGTDWTAMGSDADNAVPADRAIGTSRDRTRDLYFGGCHKVWYSNLEHGDYFRVGARSSASNFRTYSSGSHCGAPLGALNGQDSPVAQIALALDSGAA
jgi:hypothetical protein